MVLLGVGKDATGELLSSQRPCPVCGRGHVFAYLGNDHGQGLEGCESVPGLHEIYRPKF